MKQLHPLQLEILKKLLFAPSLRYSELKPNPDIENNQFDFHLDQLINSSYISKEENQYSLTTTGKEYANRIDTDKVIVAKQAKISVGVCPMRTVNGKIELLIYTRLKQPFYGCQGFMSGKVSYGESIVETAKRELKEETGLTGDAQITTIRHYRVYDLETDQLVEDKIMFFCRVEDPTGELIQSPEGKFEWVPEEKAYEYVTNHFVSMDQFRSDVAAVINPQDEIVFEEVIQKTANF